MSLLNTALHTLVPIGLTMQSWLIKETPRDQYKDHLLKCLRAHPYWKSGHLKLAKLAFSENDIALAYASAHAVLMLSASSSNSGLSARHVLAKCHLARGQVNEALVILQRLKKELPNETTVKEDEVACHMALGDNETAIDVINQIPKMSLSDEGRAAYKFLNAKLNNRIQ